jgi:vacuolar protein sorting-associated protein VTA1
MASRVPESFKSLLSVVRRAEELEKNSKREEQVVSYYCRMHAVINATKISKSPNAEEMKFINEQMGKLEKLKPTLQLDGAEEGVRTCREYAEWVFKQADDIDRAGVADKGTVKLFYSAGSFFDVLEQFGELDQAVQEKKKYAKWKATDILNALNSGKQPTPGGFGEVTTYIYQ